MTKHTSNVTAALILGTALVLGACAPSTPGGTNQQPPSSGQPSGAPPPAKKQLVVAIRGNPSVLSNSVDSASGGTVAGVREVDQLVNAGLGLVDDKGQLRPQLALSMPTVENGQWKLTPDGRMETTWTLRPNAVWHDGAPFTTADLLFSARVGQDREVPMARDPAFTYMDRLEAPDATTLVATWKQTYINADLLFTQNTGLVMTPIPEHIVGKAYADDKANLVNHPYFGQEFVGTGPFRLRSWELGSHLLLDAFDQYALGRPRLDTLEIRFILDTNTMISNMLADAVQMTLGRGLTVEQAILVRNQWRDGRVETPLIQYTAIWPQFINPDPAVLLDVRFRRALYHALDRQEIVDTFLGSLVPVADSIVNPDMPEFPAADAVTAKYPYDPARATQLLADVSSIEKRADGFYYEGGKKVSLEINTRTHDLREKLMPVMADAWSRIGIGTDPLVVPEALADDPAVRAEFRSFRFMFNPVVPERYRGSGTPLPENGFRGNNYSRYRNADFDALLDRYFVTIPTAERYQALADVVRHMSDQLIVMPLFHDSEPVLVGNRVLNAGARKGVGLQAWNAQEWDLR